MKVVVLGGGVVGTMTAYYLLRLGHAVTLVERHAEVAREASYGNGGIVHASEVMPWSQPGMPRRILQWLGKEEAPVLVRYGALPRVGRWGLDFLRNCREAPFLANTRANLRLALLSQRSFAEVRAEVGHDYDLNTGGCLKVYTNPTSLGAAIALSESLRADGMAFEVVDRAGCLEREPALAASADTLAGGIFFAGDEVGDPYKFTRGVAEYCVAKGARLLTDTVVERLEVRGGAVTGVATSAGPLVADAVVVALGVHSPALLRPLRLRLPIYPVKGVSITMPSHGWDEPVRIPVIDEGRLFALAPMGDRLRVVGSAEVAGYDTTPSRLRCRAIVDNAVSVFPGLRDCCDFETAELWAGLRPVTPSGTPLLGATPVANLFLNTGHCHQGWTLSCGSGRVVADVVAGREPDIDLRGLRWEDRR